MTSIPGYVPAIGERDLDKVIRGLRNLYEQIQVGTSANQIVTLDASAKLPAVDGSQLINLPITAQSGYVVQAQYSPFHTYTSGTTNFPNVTTAPQNTSGDQFLSVTITPTSAANKLIIDAEIVCSCSAAALAQCALFQDSIASGLVQNCFQISAGNQKITLIVHHEMTAGTTSATTFKLRAGQNAAATFYVNGDSSSATGTVQSSFIKVQEIAA